MIHWDWIFTAAIAINLSFLPLTIIGELTKTGKIERMRAEATLLETKMLAQKMGVK